MDAQAFRTQVKNALEHFYDSAALEVHPLLAELSGPQPDNHRSGADQLRAMLTAAIEGLRPQPDLPPNAPAWRCYLALHYRYVQSMSIGDIERALGISRRQVQRELRKGLDALSALLWSRWRDAPPLQTAPPARQILTQSQAASSHASRPLDQHLMLISTKLARPRVPPALVVRERLLRQLDAALAHRLTILSASAGWGKTTLLSAWVAAQNKEPRTKNREPAADEVQCSVHVAWLSLDGQDNDPTRFWLAVIAALRSCVPSVGQDALAMLLSPEPPPLLAILTVLLNDLASLAEDMQLVLILDDYHAIEDAAIHQALAFFLEHLPDQLHLMLASRVDPELPVARWRVRGELLELRAAELRFREAEAKTFFTRALGDGLADEDVRLLSQRTEGWIAGLQLAALAMRQREDRSAFVQSFTGSHRYLFDYIQEEILQHQPPPIQRFLLQTAVLPRLNAALCTALTEDTTSQGMLELLERNNLFVVPLDDERRWYRVHDLFREVLLAHLQATEPELVSLLHQRAARWYAAQDELREAISHALAGEDFAYAADLIERAAERFWLRGEAQRIHTWIGGLPDIVLWQHARLALDAALRLVDAGHMVVKEQFATVQAQVEQMLARLEAMLQQQPQQPTTRSETDQALAVHSDSEVALIQRRIRLLRALIAARARLTRGDTEGVRLLAQETEVLAAQEDVGWKLIALWITFWHIEVLEREGARLIPRLLEAKQQAMRAGNHQATVCVMRWLAFAYGRAGRLRLLHRECLEALDLVEQRGEYSASAGYFHYLLASISYAWNQLTEASRSVQHMLRIAQMWQQADLLVMGHAFLVWHALASGDLAAAEHALHQAEAIVQQERFASHTGAVVAARVEYWLAVGDLDAASTWAGRTIFSPERWDPSRNLEFMMLIRVYLAQQRYVEALEMLERFSALLDRPGDVETTIEFLALQIVALQQTGKREQACAVVVRLLALTEPEGNLWVFLDAGEPMKQVLQSLLDRPYDDKISLPPASAAFVTTLLAAFPGTENQIPKHPVLSPQSSALVEPLTEREQEVLRLLVAGASNQQIAAELVISLATVKKHVSNLLGKLGVASRTRAIARAREWSLLS